MFVPDYVLKAKLSDIIPGSGLSFFGLKQDESAELQRLNF